MSTFPLAIPPSVTWHKNPRQTHFGAERSGGFPIHGACDLIAPPGTGVVAVQEGLIIRGPYPFVTYCQGGKDETTTYAIDVAHRHFTARYGEIGNALPDGVRAGGRVTEGDVIAYVGAQCGGSMLHFELFDDPNRLDYLTDISVHKYLYVPQANYHRRNDLLDPTWLLDSWYATLPASRFA
jgi:murein DD-endopeptidase MepM/ murein hydrolase activator NlpD